MIETWMTGKQILTHPKRNQMEIEVKWSWPVGTNKPTQEWASFDDVKVESDRTYTVRYE